jgi:O-antigen/teichoic acid export membrane protein
MLASTAGGALMFYVHAVAAHLMPAPEYSQFDTLIQLFGIISIPSLGLAGVFAQQTAAAVGEEQRRQLAGTARAVVRGIFGLWLAMVLVLAALQDRLAHSLGLTHPAALWFTALFGLTALWSPIASGMLQGSQNFLWLGWIAVLGGLGRLVMIAILLRLFLGGATTAIAGACLGGAIALGFAVWQSRGCWRGPAAPFQPRAWLGRVVPLTVGLGTFAFMLSYDMIVVKSAFPEANTELYAAARKIGFGLVMFTAPLTMVMFPKIVASAARAERSNALAQALGVTALLGAAVALGCTLFPRLALRFIYPPEFLATAWLVRWFVWAMLPLALANVLLNNLLARARFQVVPWLVLLVAAYVVALRQWHASFLQAVQVVGLFNLGFFALCAWFSWRPAAVPPSPGKPA